MAAATESRGSWQALVKLCGTELANELFKKKSQNIVFSIQFYKLDPSLSSDSIFGLSQSYMVVLTGP